jgi:serine/threonine-protein kinase
MSLEMAMTVYISVYFIDTVLLYGFSGFGMPVSTTACLVFELVGAARELAPGDPRLLNLQAITAIDAGQFELAQKALDELEALQPGDVHNLQRRALLLERRGETGKAIEQMRIAVARQPSWWWLHGLARMEYRGGEPDAARQHLEELLERSPGNFQGLSLLAQIELTDGDAGRAIELYRELVVRTPGTVQLTNLGLAYLLERRYEEAAEVCRRAYEAAPGNPFFTLNLADAEALLDRQTAPDLYRKVIELTLADPDPSHWQMLTVRAQALAHLGEHRRAVAAVQEALRQAPENSQVAYEAALVYAVIGETTSAQVHAERALRLGYGARWFSFPWFDDLRKDPELSILLTEASSSDR